MDRQQVSSRRGTGAARGARGTSRGAAKGSTRGAARGRGSSSVRRSARRDHIDEDAADKSSCENAEERLYNT